MSSINRVSLSGIQGNTPSGLNNPSLKASFEGAMDKVKASQNSSQNSSIGETITKSLQHLEGVWTKSHGQSKKLVSSLPKEYQPFFEVQMSMSRIHFQTELVSKVGDSVQGTVKRLQQQGG